MEYSGTMASYSNEEDTPGGINGLGGAPAGSGLETLSNPFTLTSIQYSSGQMTMTINGNITAYAKTLTLTENPDVPGIFADANDDLAIQVLDYDAQEMASRDEYSMLVASAAFGRNDVYHIAPNAAGDKATTSVNINVEKTAPFDELIADVIDVGILSNMYHNPVNGQLTETGLDTGIFENPDASVKVEIKTYHDNGADTHAATFSVTCDDLALSNHPVDAMEATPGALNMSTSNIASNPAAVAGSGSATSYVGIGAVWIPTIKLRSGQYFPQDSSGSDELKVFISTMGFLLDEYNLYTDIDIKWHKNAKWLLSEYNYYYMTDAVIPALTPIPTHVITVENQPTTWKTEPRYTIKVNSTPGDTIRAYTKNGRYKVPYDEVIVLKVEIDEEIVNLCHDSYTGETLNLTTDSFSPCGFTWTSVPEGAITGTEDSISIPDGLDPGTYTVTATSNDLPSFSDTCTVNVLKVESLLPDKGIEVDDYDGDDDTKTFVVDISDTSGDIVTITATPNPLIAEADLPASWTLTGGTGTNKLVRTISQTTPEKYVFTCTFGASSKTTTVYILKSEFEIFADCPNNYPSDVGHSWWRLNTTPATGFLPPYLDAFTNTSTGYWPTGNLVLSPGDVLTGNQGHPNYVTHTDKITFVELKQALIYVDNLDNVPGNYSIYTNNCTHQAVIVASQAGVTIPAYPLLVDPCDLAAWINAQ
ncbi:MAG: hypothetical protein U9O87_11220 [Verrucomicrobiota bacterium]|nr:hypothetical protein [Verrucomicrobiota bacterium]